MQQRMTLDQIEELTSAINDMCQTLVSQCCAFEDLLVHTETRKLAARAADYLKEYDRFNIEQPEQ